MKSIRLSIDEIIAEFIGMFCIIFITCLTEMMYKDPSITGICLFLTYSFFNYATLRFSAAHLNPAVSLTYLLTKEISLIKFIFYVGAQMGASFIAGFLLLFFRKMGEKSLGNPWRGRFKDSEVFVVNHIQGSYFLLSFLSRSFHELFLDVRCLKKYLG